MTRCVVVESPYFGDHEHHEIYARACMADCLDRNEAPFLSHLLYTQVLNDDVPADRETGITAGLAWGDRADAVVVYTDFGVTSGMKRRIERSLDRRQRVEYRELGPPWRAA